MAIARNPRWPAPPPGEQVDHLLLQVKVLVNRRLFRQASVAIEHFAADLVMSEREKEEKPILEWSIHEMVLRREIVEILDEGGYVKIGHCDEARDDELRSLPMFGIGHLVELRREISRILELKQSPEIGP